MGVVCDEELETALGADVANDPGDEAKEGGLLPSAKGSKKETERLCSPPAAVLGIGCGAKKELWDDDVFGRPIISWTTDEGVRCGKLIA